MKLLTTSIPIPLTLVPKGVHVEMTFFGPQISFSSEYHPQQVDSSNKDFWSMYVPKVEDFLRNRYSSIVNNNKSRWIQLVNQYAEHLCLCWNTVYLLVMQQNNYGREGRLDMVDRINMPNEEFTIPDELRRMHPQVFLVKELSRELSKFHPSFRRYSRLESDLAVSGKEFDGRIVITINDPEIVKAESSNLEIVKTIENHLREQSERRLVQLFLASDEERVKYVGDILRRK